MTKIIIAKRFGNPYVAYELSNLSNLTWSVSTPVSPMPLPEDTHKENILVKMEGNSATVTLSWTLTDGANFGTVPEIGSKPFTPDPTMTAYKQISIFKNEFIPISLGDGYSIYITDDSGLILLEDKGTLTSMRFSISGDSPVVWDASIDFAVGNVIALFEADVPERPNAVEMVDNAISGKVDFIVQEFDGTADTGSPAITAANIEYQLNNNDWVNVADGTGTVGTYTTQTPSAVAVSVTGLTLGSYRFRLGLENANTAAASIVYRKDALTSAGALNLTVT